MIAVDERPLVVGLGGTTRAGSSSERALAFALAAAAAHGADTRLIPAAELVLPPYEEGAASESQAAQRLLREVERASGVLIASPGYHGSISGLLKNALDYLEELAGSERPYLDGRAVGCIVCAHGWQAAVTTLDALRSVVHALRGWPTPLGVAINSSAGGVFGEDGAVRDPRVACQLDLVARQVVDFARVQPAVAA
ncbi:MAG TPA: NADPH-dependent FMN reductase [Solirubrobacterales bacterium]|nr:NADPH-dependent FMN reductase [Solirubrobacterales bacterium]